MSQNSIGGPSRNEDERYILGLPEMDEQHRYLYSLLDCLSKHSKIQIHESLYLLLTEIEHYTQFHFACEEHLMRMYAFAGFSIHQSDHERAGQKLVQFLDDFELDRLNPAALRIFLTGWLMEHSRSSDAEYVAWVKMRRSELLC